MVVQEEESLKSFISHHQQKIFSLALYLIGGDQDKAYDIAALSFAEAIRRISTPEDEDKFLIKIISITIKKCRDTKTIPVCNDYYFTELSPAKRESLQITKTVLQALSFDAKALLLLRDQLHLPHRSIAAILRISEKKARTQVIQARIQLRKKIKEVLNRAG